MRVRIEAENQYGGTVSGEVIAWTQAVRYIGGAYFQVPAVLLRTDNLIRVVHLVNDVGVALSVTVVEE